MFYCLSVSRAFTQKGLLHVVASQAGSCSEHCPFSFTVAPVTALILGIVGRYKEDRTTAPPSLVIASIFLSIPNPLLLSEDNVGNNMLSFPSLGRGNASKTKRISAWPLMFTA